MLINHKITVLKVRELEKSFLERKVLDNVHFDIKDGDRIGLVGSNGSGKTTLANLLMGKLMPDKGIIEKSGQLKIGYLTQTIDFKFNTIHGILDGELLEHAKKLGLTKVSDWEDTHLKLLSGGEKLKLSLSTVWAGKPNLLILDEPTNHLDFKGVEWLISELSKFRGAVLIISHDRHFLDRTVQRILELEDGKIYQYNGNYSVYRMQKQQKAETQLHHYTKQKRQKEKVERQMDQLKTWTEKAHRDSTKKGSGPSKRQNGFKEFHRVKAKKLDNQIKSKMRRLQNNLEKKKIEKPKEEPSIRFQFDCQEKRGKRIAEAIQLTKKFGERTLFQDTQFFVNHGEHIGLLGENGCGKTTLIKMIMGDEGVTKGELWKSNSLKIAYLSQDTNSFSIGNDVMTALGLNDQKDIFQARTLLANLGLKSEIITKPIGTLSPGERTRVKLAEILMKEYDVLILDEPTNHLDLYCREQMEKTLGEFPGTIIAVSHDFYFLNKLCDKVLVFENGKIRRLEMKPADYLANKEKRESNQSKKETLLVIENRIAAILSELSLISHSQNNEKFQYLDQEFKALLKEKKSLLD